VRIMEAEEAKKMEQNITMTKEEWMAKGKELFGENFEEWKFVCPGCGHVQTIADFRQYKDQGSSPNSATCECIGRYSGGKSWFFDNLRRTGGPCDYAGYGLLCISPITVLDGDKEIHSFAFAESWLSKRSERDEP